MLFVDKEPFLLFPLIHCVCENYFASHSLTQIFQTIYDCRFSKLWLKGNTVSGQKPAVHWSRQLHRFMIISTRAPSDDTSFARYDMPESTDVAQFSPCKVFTNSGVFLWRIRPATNHRHLCASVNDELFPNLIKSHINHSPSTEQTWQSARD